jgi:hypothetical protein
MIRHPRLGLLALSTALALAAAPAPARADERRPAKGARAQPDKPAPAPTRPKAQPRGAGDQPATKVFDFTGIDLVGRLRSPQLLYFLDRAAEELELASLHRRSFLPEMARSIDEEGL